MSFFSISVLAVHYFLLSALCIYGVHRIYHTLVAQSATRIDTIDSQLTFADCDLPHVTVQAPIFNERLVVERLIDSLVALDYPREKIQIQVLDDSTDETVMLAANRIAEWRTKGINITHIHRKDRQGFKAGALEEALASASGDYIAIFDADFLPPVGFLKKAIPYFSSPEIGMVQTRWSHLNRDHNLLTRVQSIMLDAHFGIEQIARSKMGAFFNFNGTAGVWRKKTISDAGGWQSDTLTEDLDLSYRAQLKDWEFRYIRDIRCPSELPVNMAAFKTQQHRWAKGAIQVMKRLLVRVWKSSVPLTTKIEATFHLTGNVSYMLMFIDSLFFLLPAVHIREQASLSFLAWFDIPLFFLATLSHAFFFIFSQKILHENFLSQLKVLPALLSMSIGLGVNNGRAVIEALVGYTTDFIRTPKTGNVTQEIAIPSKRRKKQNGKAWSTYNAVSAHWADRLEIVLGGAYLGYFFWAGMNGYWIVMPFLALFSLGFLFTGLLSVTERHNFNFSFARPAVKSA